MTLPKKHSPHLLVALTVAIGVTLATGASAGPVYAITIRNHQFIPAIVVIAAGEKAELRVTNNDSEPEEFESFDLNREKMVMPGRTIRVFLPPLKPGEYRFFGEFHPKSAQGTVLVK